MPCWLGGDRKPLWRKPFKFRQEFAQESRNWLASLQSFGNEFSPTEAPFTMGKFAALSKRYR